MGALPEGTVGERMRFKYLFVGFALALLLRAGLFGAEAPSPRPRHVTHHRHALEKYTVLESCPLPGYCLRLNSSSQELERQALLQPAHKDLCFYRTAVERYLEGKEFKARTDALTRLPDDRGILFVGGGKKMLGAITATLWILRTQLNCSLPVEIAYIGEKKELQPEHIATLDAKLGPVYGLDLSMLPYPKHHNPVGQHVLVKPSFSNGKPYEAKPWAIYNSRFKQVLFLDYDSTPIMNPELLFNGPHMRMYGNLFWPDFPFVPSTINVKPFKKAMVALGLDESTVKPLLMDGQPVPYLAESGQLLIDRVRHADVLEYLWWITSNSRTMYKILYGDKDTFMLAFAAAGKASEYAQMPLPPGGLFADVTALDVKPQSAPAASQFKGSGSSKNKEQKKDTQKEDNKQDHSKKKDEKEKHGSKNHARSLLDNSGSSKSSTGGGKDAPKPLPPPPQQARTAPRNSADATGKKLVHRFQGLIHFDHFGRPAFVHQTLNKNPNWSKPPPPFAFATGPLPHWLARRIYVKDIDVFKVDPSQLIPLHINRVPVESLKGEQQAAGFQACPERTWQDWMAVQGLGIPLTPQPQMMAACMEQLAKQPKQRMVTASSRNNSDSDITGKAVIRHLTNTSLKHQAASCMESVPPVDQLQALQQQQKAHHHGSGQLQWASLLSGNQAFDQLLDALSNHHSIKAAPSWGLSTSTAQEVNRLVQWLRQSQQQDQAGTPGSLSVDTAAVASTIPTVLQFPNWELLRPAHAPGSCRSTRAFPALKLQQPGNLQLSANAAASRATAGGKGEQEPDVAWHVVEYLNTDWFPQVVQWMRSHSDIEKILM